MKRVLTAARMKECDSRTVSGGVPSAVLMERAANAVYDELCRSFDLSRTLVVCGGGNNGGDGFLAAGLLGRGGYPCDVLFAGHAERMSDEASDTMVAAKESGARFLSEPDWNSYTTVVDALFGIGLDRPTEGVYAEIIQKINKCPAAVLSVDIPSGINADTGEAQGECVTADVTVTMAAYKYGTALGEGINRAGRVVCCDIGIDASTEGAPYAIDESDLSLVPRRPRDANKGTFGRVLVIGGAPGMCGAAYLSAKAAYRSGAGLVEIFTSEMNRTVIQTLLPEAVVTSYGGVIPDTALLQTALGRADTVVLGPGLGQTSCARLLVRETYKNVRVPVICDADALNVSAADSLAFPDSVPVIVTPHPGELSRLTGRGVADLANDRIGSAVTYAAENGVICVSKFARSVIADGKSVFVNMSGSPALSKGGSGDVLTGVIAGMLCCGMSPLGAAALGVYIHGRAGEAAAEKYSEYSSLAGEVCDLVPEIMKSAGKKKPAGGKDLD